MWLWDNFKRRVMNDNRGFLGMALALGGSYLAGKALKKRDKKDKSSVEGVEFPEYYNDPYFADNQKYMQDYGRNMMEGNYPEHLKGIGESGGSEFENYLALTNRDISQGAQEAMVAGGRGRGGAMPGAVAQGIGDNSTKARYADYLRSLEGKQYLNSEGVNAVSGVREAGFANQGAKNSFNVQGANFNFDKASYMDSYNRRASEDAGNAMGNLGSMLPSIAQIGLGIATGNPMMAISGGAGLIGGSSGGGGSYMDIFSSFGKGKAVQEGAKPGMSDSFGKIQPWKKPNYANSGQYR